MTALFYRFPIERTVRLIQPSRTSFDGDVVRLADHPLAGDRPCDSEDDRDLIEKWSAGYE